MHRHVSIAWGSVLSSSAQRYFTAQPYVHTLNYVSCSSELHNEITAPRDKVTSVSFKISILMYLSASALNTKKASAHLMCFSFKALHHSERVTTWSNLGLFPWKITPACPWTACSVHSCRALIRQMDCVSVSPQSLFAGTAWALLYRLMFSPIFNKKNKRRRSFLFILRLFTFPLRLPVAGAQCCRARAAPGANPRRSGRGGVTSSRIHKAWVSKFLEDIRNPLPSHSSLCQSWVWPMWMREEKSRDGTFEDVRTALAEMLSDASSLDRLIEMLVTEVPRATGNMLKSQTRPKRGAPSSGSPLQLLCRSRWSCSAPGIHANINIFIRASSGGFLPAMWAAFEKYDILISILWQQPAVFIVMLHVSGDTSFTQVHKVFLTLYISFFSDDFKSFRELF